ncbi:MAG: hypothetical protein IIC13_11375 [SAR324 cluster bacterium]|nr:hypothetical protein [SAR324 cluster bacterium]
MNKSILVLDENSVIHGLISSALDMEGLKLHHEFNPEKFVERASSVMPDLILVGKSEQDPELSICRQLKETLEQVPLVLMTGSMDSVSPEDMKKMQVAGVVRKPFEASDLQQQVGRHLDISDLVGAGYEFRQSQITGEEAPNPLANLDVVDDEVLELMRENGGTPPPPDAEPGVVGEDVLAETLEPERAFEKIDSGEGLQSAESMEGAFQEEEPVILEDESELEELSAEDLLEEEAPEEAILEPAGFDQSLEEGETSGGEETPALPEMEEIEVELPDSALDVEGMKQEFAGDKAEPPESEPPEPSSSEDVKENIPLSVRRMMDLKPVFSREDSTASGGADADGLSIEPDDAEVEALQSELDTFDDIGDGKEEIEEQEIEFLDQSELEDLEETGTDQSGQLFEAAGDEAAGDEAAGDEAAGDEAAGDEAAGDKAAGDGLEVIDLDAEELEAGEIGEEAADAFAMPPVEPDTLGGLDDGDATADDTANDTADGGPLPEGVAEEKPAVAAEPDEKGDEDYFLEEYLGDEEIDEDQIISAEDPEEFPELTEEDEKELDFLVSEEEQELSQLDSLEDEQFATDGENEIIELDQDEDDLIGTSLEEDPPAEDGGKMPLDPAASEEPLFERNFNALDEEQGTFTSGGIDSASLEEAPPVGDAAEPGAQSITLEGTLGTEGEEDGGESTGDGTGDGAGENTGEITVEGAVEGAVDDDAIWEPETPASFVAKPNEEFPSDAVQEPFTGRQEEAGDPSPTPRFTADEVLEDPDTMEPVLPMDESQLEEAPEIAGLVMEGEKEVPEQSLAEAMEAMDQSEGDDLVSMLSADEHPDASDFIPSGESSDTPELVATEEGAGDGTEDGAEDGPEDSAEDSAEDTDSEFDSLFSSMQDDIAAHPDGEHLDDVLRLEGIRARVAALDLALPQNESPFSRAVGIYALAGEAGDSAYPSAMWGKEGVSAQPAAGDAEREVSPAIDTPTAPPGVGLESGSLLDADIRTKLGAVLDEIISVSVRKAVQEEMPKFMERMSKET